MVLATQTTKPIQDLQLRFAAILTASGHGP